MKSTSLQEIRHLCSYLQDLKKASAEEMRRSVYANYAAFIRSGRLAVAPLVQFHLVLLSIVTFVLEMSPINHDDTYLEWYSLFIAANIVFYSCEILYNVYMQTHHDSGIFSLPMPMFPPTLSCAAFVPQEEPLKAFWSFNNQYNVTA